ncbi:hypothetical protein VNO78_21804 [Psophocarpus tetragonolobus]|uniref:Uncharacterized protein n=1 Tax=Psophocarpus tetragonolobus TaxID=3891 RepID=A0AAN9SD99_PSOTE
MNMKISYSATLVLFLVVVAEFRTKGSAVDPYKQAPLHNSIPFRQIMLYKSANKVPSYMAPIPPFKLGIRRPNPYRRPPPFFTGFLSHQFDQPGRSRFVNLVAEFRTKGSAVDPYKQRPLYNSTPFRLIMLYKSSNKWDSSRIPIPPYEFGIGPNRNKRPPP